MADEEEVERSRARGQSLSQAYLSLRDWVVGGEWRIEQGRFRISSTAPEGEIKSIPAAAILTSVQWSDAGRTALARHWICCLLLHSGVWPAGAVLLPQSVVGQQSGKGRQRRCYCREPLVGGLHRQIVSISCFVARLANLAVLPGGFALPSLPSFRERCVQP